MAVQKIGFVGFRTGKLDQLRRVLEEGLGLGAASATDLQVTYALSDGTKVEGYGEAEDFHSFFTTGPVVGFEVDDFDAALRRLAGLKVEFITEVQEADGKKWVHFRLPDGTVAEIMGLSRS